MCTVPRAAQELQYYLTGQREQLGFELVGAVEGGEPLSLQQQPANLKEAAAVADMADGGMEEAEADGARGWLLVSITRTCYCTQTIGAYLVFKACRY